ncbi:restriction endonuclease [Acinetobacter sp. SWAC5]|uniref:AbaSI family restriction endonuclease n=2 Tax=Moraxellaceae TaxID=468 RepID=UPI000E34C834|nr:restriction endonuclease [Acinetobacter sp. SWAC5]RFS29258.1 restriction endonuclease [Acinetobacter sp. SWAC5]
MSSCYEQNSELYTEYFFKQLNKTKNKVYEAYVINRILTLLNDHSIKFVTQQYVRLSEYNYALVDIYFPQLGVLVEIDEGHHFDLEKNEVKERNGEFKVEEKVLKQTDKDKLRQSDIVNSTKQEIERINVFRNTTTSETISLKSIDKQTDKIIELLKNKKLDLKSQGKFQDWDIEKEFNPKTYIEKGYLDADENVLFLNAKKICECFGVKYLERKGGTWLNDEKKIKIWYPKFFENEQWSNSIASDGLYIDEKTKIEEKIEKMNDIWSKKEKIRLVFGAVKNNLMPKGRYVYQFYGVYELDVLNSDSVRWKRISKRYELKSNTFNVDN